VRATAPHAFEFGPYRFEVEERLLRRGTEVIRLTPKAFDTLALLVRRSGHLLTKEELIEELWPDAHVEENNLAQYISLLRRTLEDGMEGSAYIETVPRVGYRFLAAVRELNGANGNGAHAGGSASSLAQSAKRNDAEAEIREPDSLSQMNWVRRRAKLLIVCAAAFAIVAYVALGPIRALVHPPPPLHSLAVLPFQQVSDDRDAPALGLTFAAELNDRLARSTSGHMLPVSSAYRFLGASIVPIAAGRELHADAVLSGRILKKDASQFEITASAIRVADGREIWSETRAYTAAQLSIAVDRIADRAARALAWNHEVSPGRDPANASSFAAREAYVMGRYLWNTRSAEGVFRSTALLERAVTLAPQDGVFHAGLADALAFDMGNWRRAEDEARAALQLDKTSGEAHASLGFIRLFWERDRDAAESEFKQAIQLRPEYATAHQWYALARASHGSFGAAQAEIHQARQLDAYSLPILADECHIAYLARQFEPAQAACEEVIHADPNFLAAHLTLLEIYEQTGKGKEALAEYFRIRAIPGSSPFFSIVSAEELHRDFEQAGLPGVWRAETQAFEKLAPLSLAHPLRMAQDYARLNEREAALTYLNRLSASSDLDSLFVWNDPVFDSLHSDPRFDATYARIVTPRHGAGSAAAR
jgi:DNA-binding winged helix-turn-helix (wHTH) protein/Tfp pilus assembly protein PilF/TolB-like protein